MKKAYSMPAITVEELQLDHPIAVGCDANPADMDSLRELDYFYDSCVLNIELPVNQPQDNDTICYHSNIIKAFRS